MTTSHRASRRWPLHALKQWAMDYDHTTARQIAARDIAGLIAASAPAVPHCAVGVDLCPGCARADQAAIDAGIARKAEKWR